MKGLLVCLWTCHDLSLVLRVNLAPVLYCMTSELLATVDSSKRELQQDSGYKHQARQAVIVLRVRLSRCLRLGNLDVGRVALSVDHAVQALVQLVVTRHLRSQELGQ